MIELQFSAQFPRETLIGIHRNDINPIYANETSSNRLWSNRETHVEPGWVVPVT